MKRFTLELGGKSAAIVLDDADVEMASTFISLGCMAYSGQACAALTRVLVPRARYGEFVDSLNSAMKSFAAQTGASIGTLVHPTRLACTGKTVGPSLYHLMEVLGKDRVIQRFESVLEKMG